MKIPLTLLATCLILTPLALPAAAGSDAEPVPEWMDAFLARAAAASGLSHVSIDDLTVERRVTTPDGAVTVETLTGRDALAAIAAMLRDVDPTAPAASTDVPPDVVLGDLSIHVMIQFGVCAGYDDLEVASGLRTVQGSWDFGVHVALGPVAGGRGIGTADPATALIVTAQQDTTMTAVGVVTVSEVYVSIFGICLATLGSLAGTGVFAFDVVL